MKRIWIFFIFLALTAGSAAPAGPAYGQPLAPGVLIVKLPAGQDPGFLLAYATAKPERLYDTVYRLRVADAPAVLGELQTAPGVVFVQQDQIIKEQSLTTNDPLFTTDVQDLTKQWSLQKMQVPQAWAQTVGNNITIAVVDTGIDGKHEDLNDGRVVSGFASFCQVMNPNGSEDCLVRNNGDLPAGVNSDDNGHGTIIAGILGAIPNNSKGLVGIDWNVRLMPVKSLDSTGTGLASDVALGIRWAADNGARIINLSVGGPGIQGLAVLQDAIAYAFNKNILIVAASGNDAVETGGDLNKNPELPVCAGGAQHMVLGVAAVDANDRKAKFSNYGSDCIDISAPGTGTFVDRVVKQGIVSTYFDPSRPGVQNLYVYAIGTSVAAPMVSGVAALVMSAFPNLDAKGVRDRLLGTADNIDGLNTAGCDTGSCVGQIGRGRVNAYRAVSATGVVTSGVLYQDSAGRKFLIDSGSKRPVSDFVYEQRFAGAAATLVPDVQLSGLPTGWAVPPLDGTLIKSAVDPTVYLIAGGARQALSYVSFVSRRLRFSDVVTLPDAEVAAYPRLADAPVQNGVLMMSPVNPAVFILNNGRRQLISYFVFLERGFVNVPIAILPPDELGLYPFAPSSPLYPPLDGTLIRGDASDTVYLVQNGLLVGLSLAAFQSRGYQFADVHTVPQSEIAGYALGQSVFQ